MHRTSRAETHSFAADGARQRADERSCVDALPSGLSDDKRAEVIDQLRRVIAWEVDAQVGVQRAVQDMPPLIADTLLDYFEVRLKPGVDLSALD